MSEITLALEHPSLGCGEIIARYDLSEIQEKAYQQGRTDAIEEIKSKISDIYENYATKSSCQDMMEEIIEECKKLKEQNE